MSQLRLPPGPVDLTALPTAATPGFDGDKSEGKAALAELGEELADLQERLFAEGRSGASRRVLVVLQGMDTSGKGGVLRHTVGLVDPQGVRIESFGPPSAEEARHHFLWRIKRALPRPGYLGVFDRSHYEDVLVARVRELAPPEEIEQRYDQIRDFEADLATDGIVLVKCLLHISPETQAERLRARLDKPDKHWKYDPGDIDERARWTDYRRAHEIALERTNTEVAPWYVVPADRKWYRNLAVGRLLLDTLRGMNPQWPPGNLDVAAEKQRLADQGPVA